MPSAALSTHESLLHRTSGIKVGEYSVTISATEMDDNYYASHRVGGALSFIRFSACHVCQWL